MILVVLRFTNLQQAAQAHRTDDHAPLDTLHGDDDIVLFFFPVQNFFLR